MKKKVLICALFVWLLLGINVFAIDGDGSKESPFLITTQEELGLISDFPEYSFKLMNDIVLEGEWIPLCQDTAFSGTFDGNGYTISNLQITGNYDKTGLFAVNNGLIKSVSIETSEIGIVYNKDTYTETYIGILTAINNGTIEKCHVQGEINHTNKKYSTGGSGGTSSIKGYAGGITANNTGTITKSSASVNVVLSMYRYFETSVKIQYGGKAHAGGIAGNNSGDINSCKADGAIKIASSYYSYAGGIVGKGENGSINSSYFKGDVNEYAYTHGTTYLGYSGGIVGYGYISNSKYSDTNNCYAVCSGCNYGIGASIDASNCFYDKTVSGLTDTTHGTPKSTLAMKMKATYTDWDFENVWGISPDKNDGFPYLLWEYEDKESLEPSEPTEPEESIVSVSIVKAESVTERLKMISCVANVGEKEIESFGTTFIPLWLFETGATNTAIVQYDNSNYNIQDGQTFGATLSGIPSLFKDMAVVGKSFIKDTDGNYIWSDAKYASISDTTLKNIE